MTAGNHAPPALQITTPPWLDGQVEWGRRYPSIEERMGLAIHLSRENVVRQTGGPFASAVFEADGGALVAVGLNSVTRLNNSVLHGETVAIMLAQQRLGSFTLAAPGLPPHQLVSSCEPCAMCLGATFWSGVRSLVFGASREDASALSFDEGPVFPESYAYLEARGIRVVRDVLRAEAAAVLELYGERGGTIYNA